ncbi:hypothetical protein ACTX1M_20650, partial [Pseudomonas aeruginosa]|uniref:hypothetical protein n=1 Tax=Pseudomonas aeruginosa TaxID=287 RepID=UPI003FD1565B
FWHWALGADGGHGHAQPPFRSSRLIGAERQPTSDCRQSLQQSRLVQITSDIELSGAGCTTAITPNQLVQSSSENDMSHLRASSEN